jgi:Cap4 SAVED domain
LTDLAELNRLLPDAPTLAVALSNLARGDPASLDAYLVSVERDVPVEGTKTRAHCYFLAVDGNGRVRVADFVQRICEHVIDFAIPRSKIREASDYLRRTGSTQKWVRLSREAKDLFTDLATTGEGGELILFTLAEHLLGLPQIICKMALKTSEQMHYHGADGIHASIDPETGLLSLYWGESKMFSAASDAISDCFASLAPFLTGERGRERRDVQLLNSYVDLDNPQLEEAIKHYLDPDHVAFNRAKYCGLAFVGFDSTSYPPEDQRAEAQRIAAAVQTAAAGWRSHIGRRCISARIDQVDIHFVCIPFPSVQAFRDRFLQELGLANVSS